VNSGEEIKSGAESNSGVWRKNQIVEKSRIK